MSEVVKLMAYVPNGGIEVIEVNPITEYTNRCGEKVNLQKYQTAISEFDVVTAAKEGDKKRRKRLL